MLVDETKPAMLQTVQLSGQYNLWIPTHINYCSRTVKSDGRDWNICNIVFSLVLQCFHQSFSSFDIGYPSLKLEEG